MFQAIVATCIYSLICGLQYYQVFPGAPQATYMGINILALVVQIVRSLWTDPATGRSLILRRSADLLAIGWGSTIARSVLAAAIFGAIAALQHYQIIPGAPQWIYHGANILAIIVQVLSALNVDPIATKRSSGGNIMTGMIIMMCMLSCSALTGCAALLGSLPAILTALQEIGAILPLVQSIEGALDLIWKGVYPLIAQADQATAQADYEKARTSVDDAVMALADLSSAGTNANNNQIAAAITDVESAITSLYQAVSVWTTSATEKRAVVRVGGDDVTTRLTTIYTTIQHLMVDADKVKAQLK